MFEEALFDVPEALSIVRVERFGLFSTVASNVFYIGAFIPLHMFHACREVPEIVGLGLQRFGEALTHPWTKNVIGFYLTCRVLGAMWRYIFDDSPSDYWMYLPDPPESEIALEELVRVRSQASLDCFEGMDETNLCVLCYEREKCMFLLPCQHFCMCQACCKLVFDCPICRRRIKKKYPVFNS